MVDHLPSRRSFLSVIAAAGVTAGAAVPAIAIPTSKPTGPLSPAEYLKEMMAIGWRPVAGDFRGQPLGVIEHGPEDHQALADSWDEFRRIQVRVSKSGADFWKRCSVYLFERDLREDVGPKPQARSNDAAVEDRNHG